MYFRQILHDEKACASYLVGCPTKGVCAVIDPQGDPAAYVEKARKHGMVVRTVVETHVHADHLSTARDLAALAAAPLHLGPGASVRYKHVALSDGQVLPVGNRRLTVLHTPGHTPEHVCFLVDDWFVLTGDTLFVGDVGRVDLALEEPPPGEVAARARDLRRSLERLLTLPDWTEVYPGHYAGSVCGRGLDGKPVTTIGRERRANLALRMTEDAFIAFQTTNVPLPPDDFVATKRRNQGA